MRTILDLCGGTGAWSRPYQEAGYDVRIVTLPEHDVRIYEPPENVYGILAAPPCDDFAVSGARWFKDKDESGKTIESMGVVIACLRIIAQCKPVFWAIENPVSKLSRWLGKPRLIFNPCDYGDAYTKRTCVWGNFNIPEKKCVEPTEGSKMHLLPPSEKRKELRSITPAGFAQAFFMANIGTSGRAEQEDADCSGKHSHSQRFEPQRCGNKDIDSRVSPLQSDTPSPSESQPDEKAKVK